MKSKYFKLKELVSEDVLAKYGDKAWEFLDDRLIITLDQIREALGKPMVVNTSSMKQRGYRANKDPMVANKSGYYCSQHTMGRAVDFHVIGMSIEEVYNYIKENYKQFPYLRRLEHIESAPTWVHIDLANTGSEELVIFRG